MIQFNELKITPIDKTLILDVSIKDDPNYSNVFLDQVFIGTQDTYIGLDIDPDNIYSKTIEGNTKIFRAHIKSTDLEDSNLYDNLLFIYVTSKGSPNDEITDDIKPYNMRVIVDLELIYKTIIKLISNQQDQCDDNSKLVDLILKVNALDIALKTCNYPIAIKYWNKFFTRKKLNELTFKCNQK